jgi:hypothetical protein
MAKKAAKWLNDGRAVVIFRNTGQVLNGARIREKNFKVESSSDSPASAGSGPVRSQDSLLGDPDVLGARPLRTLPALECHRLTFAQFVEACPAARGLMKKVLAAVACGNEAESLVGQPFDRAVHRRHVASPVNVN